MDIYFAEHLRLWHPHISLWIGFSIFLARIIFNFNNGGKHCASGYGL